MTVLEVKHQGKLREWQERIIECRSSRKPVKAWCQEQGVSATTYYRWEREVFERVGQGKDGAGPVIARTHEFAEAAAVQTVVVAAHKRHKKHEYTLDHLPENVPVEVVEHRLPEKERVCPECGSIMDEIGKEVRRRLKLEPPKAVVVEDRYYTYACRKCEKEDSSTCRSSAEIRSL